MAVDLPSHQIEETWTSPDGRRLLYRGSSSCMGDSEYDVILVDLEGDRRLLSLAEEKLPAAPGRGGKIFATVPGSRIEIRSLETGEVLRTLEEGAGSWVLGPEDRIAVLSRYRHREVGEILVADLETGRILSRFQGDSAGVDPDEERVAVRVGKHLVRLHEAGTGELLWEAPVEPPGVTYVFFSSCGAYVVADSDRGSRARSAPDLKALTFFRTSSGEPVPVGERELISVPATEDRFITYWSPRWPKAKLEP